MTSRILAFILATLCAYGAYRFALGKGFVNPYPVVCNLVSEKFYLQNEDLAKWTQLCLHRSRLVTPYSSRSLIIKDLNNVFLQLKASHLEVYDAQAVKSIWMGEELETGIESEFVDSELVVFKVHAGSPAEKVGLKKGDVIRAINGEQPSPWEAQTTSGEYQILRQGEERIFDLKTASFVRSEEVSVEKIKNGRALLTVPSFRGDFFSEEKMKVISQELTGVRRLVVDLRGNIGGNFVAGLRLLSLMVCEPTEIGRLLRPRVSGTSRSDLPDVLSDEKQLEIFNKNREVVLKTFPQKFCYQGDVRVLVDGKTASVAEMVAQALKEFKEARLLGSPSRGQLLVGVWYPVSEIGPGVEVSIPEALYTSRKHHRIEGQGVELDKVLYYNLPEMQSGIDSWVQRALD